MSDKLPQCVDEVLKSIVGGPQYDRMCDLIKRKDDCAIDYTKVRPVDDSKLLDYSKLTEDSNEKLKEFLKKIAILKLNGGLGTTVGSAAPISTITVKEHKNFLQLIFEQCRYLNQKFDVNIPVLLMNSFNTELATFYWVSKNQDLDIRCFNQNQFPRLYSEDLMPMANSPDSPSYCWYPPGHGDVYDSLEASGILNKLISEGKEYVFISNCDNLAATVDMKILTRLFTSDFRKDVLMELTPKLPQDVKGSTVITYPLGKEEDGKRKLKDMHVTQVEPQYQEEFKSQRKFSVFTTNNMWINLAFLRRILDEKKLHLDVITNRKVIIGKNVMQLETASGSIVGCASDSEHVDLVLVPRTRFVPMKMCSDLMLIRSDYFLVENGTLVVNPLRNFNTLPVLSLGPWLSKIDGLELRCPSIPKLVDLGSLTVCGEVSFGMNVTLKGDVIIMATEGKKLFIPPHCVLENVSVQGFLEVIPLMEE